MPLYSAAKNRATKLPSTNAVNPMQWFTDWIGGGEAASGIQVDADNAISLSTVFNALTLLSESVAQLPVAPYITEEDNGVSKRRVYKEHFSYSIVAKRPNEFMSSHTFRKVMQGWLCRYDRSYAAISRNGNGQATSMFPLHPERVALKVSNNNELYYEVDGEEKLSPASVFHLIGYTDNGLEGKSRIDLLQEGLGNALATEQFSGKYFGKGVNVGGFIKMPGQLRDSEAVERLKKSFVQANAGQNNQGGVGVLEDGAEWQPNEVEPEKAQLNETRKVNGQTVAQIWNIPLSFLKYLDSTSYNESEQEDLKFSKYTLSPWCVNWEQEYERKLLTENEKRAGNIYFKHNMNALLRGDMESRGAFYESMSKTGAYSPNHILQLEDENGYEGGDAHVIPGGYQTVEQLQNQETNQDDEESV